MSFSKKGHQYLFFETINRIHLDIGINKAGNKVNFYFSKNFKKFFDFYRVVNHSILILISNL